MPAEKRLELALRMSDTLREVTAAGVRQRHPTYSSDQVRLAVIRLSLGDELFRKVYPDATCGCMNQEDFLAALAERLEEAGIPFMVTGSFGSSFHGEPRATNDIDLVIDPTLEQLDLFLALLGENYYVNPEAARGRWLAGRCSTSSTLPQAGKRT